jgi:Domain of unknown function (DUF4863)
MPTAESIHEAMRPLLRAISRLDLSRPEEAEQELERCHPASSLSDLERLLKDASAEGWLTPIHPAANIAFGRLAPPSAETHDLSIDAIDLAGIGAPHGHPRGEVNLCFAVSGDPKFCGKPVGWVVAPPGSQHLPVVTGGRMLVIYFLPFGEIKIDLG